MYDEENALVIWVSKLSEEEIELGLFQEVIPGWYEIDAVGLRKENWVNKGIRDEYLWGWCREMEFETQFI